MSITKRDHSKHWYIQFQFRGKTYIRSSKTTDKRVAEQMERALREDPRFIFVTGWNEWTASRFENGIPSG